MKTDKRTSFMRIGTDVIVRNSTEDSSSFVFCSLKGEPLGRYDVEDGAFIEEEGAKPSEAQRYAIDQFIAVGIVTLGPEDET